VFALGGLEDRADIVVEFHAGVRLADLALQHDVQPSSIRYVLAKSGVELGRKAVIEVKTDQQYL
jgi:hypothetical protein